MDFDFSKNLDESSLNHYCPVNTVKFRPILSLKNDKLCSEMRAIGFYTKSEKVQFRQAEFSSPWRGELPSPVGFCHVIRIRWDRLTSPGRIFSRHGEVPLSWTSTFLEVLAFHLAIISPWRNISPWPSMWRGSLELSGSARLLARHYLAMAKFLAMAISVAR